MAASKFALLVLGVLLLIAGYIVQTVQAGLAVWSVSVYVLAAAALVWYVAANRTALKQIFTGRGARHGAYSLISIVAFIGILVVIGLFSEKHHHRWDLTEAKTHTLALQSRQLMDKLEQDTLELHAYVFYRGEAGLRGKQNLVDLLESYSYHSDNFTYETVDIDRNPLLAMQLGITGTSATILTYGERQEKIYGEQEAVITQAVANLLETGDAATVGEVFYLTGHGEPSLEPAAGGEGLSASRAVEEIEEQIGPVSELVMAGGRGVPDTCDVLIVGGPRSDLLPAELDSIAAYIGRGGSVLFLVEPFMADSLAEWLGNYGVDVGRNVVVDMLKGAPTSPLAFLADDYQDHEITRLLEVGTVFDMARSVDRGDSPQPGVEISVLVNSSEKSVAATDSMLQADFGAVADSAMEAGSVVPLAVSVVLPVDRTAPDTVAGAAPAESYARLVVFGDRHLFIDGYLQQLGNRDLLLNTLRWLGGQADRITIQPRETESTPLNLTDGELMMIGLITVVGLPVAIVFVGLFVWVRRRARR